MLTTIVKIVLNSSITETLDKSALESVNSEIKTKFDQNTPSFGISAGTGSITFKDINKKFIDYSRSGLLTPNKNVEIYVKDTISGKEQIVGKWLSKEWNYNSDDFSVSVSLKDNIEELSSVETNGSIDSLDVFTRKYGNEILDFLKSLTPDKFEFETTNSEVSAILSNIYFNLPYIPKNNLWGLFQEFCEVCMIQMSKNREGKLSFKYIK